MVKKYTILKAMRKDCGMNQVELAKRMGLSMTQISNLERGHSNMLPRFAENLAKVMGTNSDMILIFHSTERLFQNLQMKADKGSFSEADLISLEGNLSLYYLYWKEGANSPPETAAAKELVYLGLNVLRSLEKTKPASARCCRAYLQKHHPFLMPNFELKHSVAQ